MGLTAVSDIDFSSVTLKTWRKEPEKKCCNFEALVSLCVSAANLHFYFIPYAKIRVLNKVGSNVVRSGL